MEIDYNEVFDLPDQVEEGAEEQEAAEPAQSEGVEEQEAAAPAVEETPEEPTKTEDDARFAAARRQAERERDEAIARARREAQEEAQRTIDEAFKHAGMTNPYTKTPITNKAEYDEYLKRYQQEQRETVQRKAGLSQEQYQQFVNSLPEVQQARAAQAQAERASMEARQQAAKVRLDEQIQEIHKLDPSIKDIKDLTQMPNYQAFYDLVKRGNNFVDAYKLANFDALTQRTAQASRQAAIKQAASKEHLTTTTARGQGAAPVPVDIMQEYKAFNPDATEEQIQRHYQKYLKK